MTTRRIPFLAPAAFAAVAVCWLAAQVWAASPEAARPLLPQNDPVGLPGIGRVVIAFVLTVGIGIAAAYALRRWLPKLGTHTPLAGNLRVVSRANVYGGLRLHVVEVAGRTVLVAESRSGIAMTLLENNESKKEAQPGP